MTVMVSIAVCVGAKRFAALLLQRSCELRLVPLEDSLFIERLSEWIRCGLALILAGSGS